MCVCVCVCVGGGGGGGGLCSLNIKPGDTHKFSPWPPVQRPEGGGTAP